jgi:hypothetical protein
VLSLTALLSASNAAAAGPPSIRAESVSGITTSDATLEATIDPQGAEGVVYQFQLLLDPGEAPDELQCPSAHPSPFDGCGGPVNPEALPLELIAGSEVIPARGFPVSLDLTSAEVALQPATTYYYRVLAATRKPTEDTLEWEAPTVAGSVKSFTTPSLAAQPLSMSFTEDRANVGVQLADAPMFAPPTTAPLAAQIDPGTGSITAGALQVPDFTTHITEPLDADVNVHFEIGIIEGAFDQANGALTLQGEANATLTSEGKQCSVTTTPDPLILSTAGNSGGANPRSGTPFANGLTGAGAIAGQWTDMSAEPKVPGQGVAVCNTVDERIEGPGGIWLVQEGDVVPPAPPQLTSTDPTSPGTSATPRIRGSAESGSKVHLYAGPGCSGAPLASPSAAALASPGIAVTVDQDATASFSATATDAAHNTSACSAPISYTRLKAPTPTCTVPKLAGKTLPRAKAALKDAGCALGKVTRPKARKGHKRGPLVVKSSKAGAGMTLPFGSEVNLKLGLKVKPR